jgi:hypothetical protein
MALDEQGFRDIVRHYTQGNLVSIISGLLGAPNYPLRFDPERVLKLEEEITRAVANFIDNTPVEPVQELVSGGMETEWAQKLDRLIATNLRMSQEWWEAHNQMLATLKNPRPSGRH